MPTFALASQYILMVHMQDFTDFHYETAILAGSMAGSGPTGSFKDWRQYMVTVTEVPYPNGQGLVGVKIQGAGMHSTTLKKSECAELIRELEYLMSTWGWVKAND